MQNPSTSAEALTQLQQAQQASKNPNDYLAGQEATLGVGTARNTVTGLQGAIDSTTRLLSQVAPSVMGRTANSLVTSAQATRQIGNEQAPLNETLTKQGGEYNKAATNLTNLQNQAQTAASGQYTGEQNKLSYMQNLYNTMYTKEQNAAQAAAQIAADAENKRRFEIQQAESTRQFAESTRQFNVQQAQSSAKASTPSASDTKSADQKAIAQALNDASGKDNYVSPYSYKMAKDDWVSSGYSSDEFDKIFSNKRNPYSGDSENGAKRSKADYGIA